MSNGDDIKLKIGAELAGLQKDIKKAKSLAEKAEEKQKKSTERQAKATAKIKERVAQKHAQTIHSLQINELRKNEQMERRLSRKRARNRLRQIKARIREENRLERQAIKHRSRMRRGLLRKAKWAGVGLAGLGVGAGIGGIMAIRDVLEFDVRLAKTAAQADITTEAQMKLKDSIQNAGIQYGVSRDIILNTIEEIIDKSGNIALATENIDDFSKIIRGTRSEAKDIGALFAAAFNAFKGTANELDPGKIADYVEVLVAQGDKAQINIANMANSSEKLFGAFKGAGLKTLKDFIDFGALIQASGEASEAAEAATSAVRFLDRLFTRGKDLKKLGIDVFKPGTKKELKEISEILIDLMEKTGGDVSVLHKIFGEEALKPLKILSAEYKSTGTIGSYLKSIDIGREAKGVSQRKFNTVAKTASQGFERLMGVLTKGADTVLVDVLNDVSDAIQKMIDEPQKLKQFESTFREIGDTLRIVAKAGALITKPIGKIVEDIDVKREISKLPFKERFQAMKGTFFKVGTSRREQIRKNLEGMQLNVKTNVVLDRTGVIKKQKEVVELLANADRGE